MLTKCFVVPCDFFLAWNQLGALKDGFGQQLLL